MHLYSGDFRNGLEYLCLHEEDYEDHLEAFDVLFVFFIEHLRHQPRLHDDVPEQKLTSLQPHLLYLRFCCGRVVTVTFLSQKLLEDLFHLP